MSDQQVIFQYLSAGSHTLTVPDGFSNQVLVYAWGAGGADSQAGVAGGGGGFAQGIVTVSSGDTVIISVGSTGSSDGIGGDGSNPVISLSGGSSGARAGGGAASTVLVNGVPMIVAGGGGGAGGSIGTAGGSTTGTPLLGITAVPPYPTNVTEFNKYITSGLKGISYGDYDTTDSGWFTLTSPFPTTWTSVPGYTLDPNAVVFVDYSGVTKASSTNVNATTFTVGSQTYTRGNIAYYTGTTTYTFPALDVSYTANVVIYNYTITSVSEASALNSIPQGGISPNGGGGGGGYPFGGAGGTSEGGGAGGYGGQSYANSTVITSELRPGTASIVGGSDLTIYPKAKRGYNGYDGAVIVIFTKSFRAWIKDTDWKEINNAWVKVGDTPTTATRTVTVPPGTVIDTVPGGKNITTSGASNWTVPSGVTSLTVTAVGGGGGGGAVGTATVPVSTTRTVNYTTSLYSRLENEELITWAEGLDLSAGLVDATERANYKTQFASRVDINYSSLTISERDTIKSIVNSVLDQIFDVYNTEFNKLSSPVYIVNLTDAAITGSGTVITSGDYTYRRSTSRGSGTYTVNIDSTLRSRYIAEAKTAFGTTYTSSSGTTRSAYDALILYVVDEITISQLNSISSSVNLYDYTVTPNTGGSVVTVSAGGGGGSGGVTTNSTLAVTPGEIIRVDVGGGGASFGGSTVVRALSETVTSSGGGKGSNGTSSSGGGGGSTASGGSLGSSGEYSSTGGAVAGGSGGVNTGNYGNGGRGESSSSSATAGNSGAVLITYTQTTYTTTPTTTTETYVVSTTAGGWKQITRAWIKNNDIWKPIQSGVSLVPVPSTADRVTINITIAASTNNYVLSDFLSGTSYIQGRSTITLTVNAGVIVGSDTVGTPALIIDELTDDDTITLINNGNIAGAGGLGGAAGSYSQVTSGGSYTAPAKGSSGYFGSGKGSYSAGTTSITSVSGRPGEIGGPALYVTYRTNLVNNGTIAGGGGGGGGGGGPTGGQGGGGAGRKAGSGANNGTLTAGGAGSGLGGAAGARGSAGSAGTNSSSAGGLGGDPGAAIIGIDKVTITTEGTILGTRIV